MAHDLGELACVPVAVPKLFEFDHGLVVKDPVQADAFTGGLAAAAGVVAAGFGLDHGPVENTRRVF